MTNAPLMTVAKPWWKSRTIVLNVMSLAVLIVGVLVENATLLRLPDAWVNYLTVLVAILNVVNRFTVVQPIDNSSRATDVPLVQTSPDGTAAVVR